MRLEEENNILADILFPEVEDSVEDILNRYPKRENDLVLRYAPSPTGYLHIGGVYAALINMKLARQSENGIFFVRIEDTDQKREVGGAIEVIINGLEDFGIDSEEGVLADGSEIGIYGPYIQSKRVDIYKVFAKELVKKGYAYPCFASEEELNELREKQKSLGTRIGYYGEYAIWRDRSLEDIKKALEEGRKFVIRLYSTGNFENTFNVKDLVKGNVTIRENDMDAVLLKSDGIPTYHFAHPIDDTLMGISYILRGDEWFASVALNTEIFSKLGFKQLQYGHLAPLMKIDNGGKRKLSKRKDPEADVRFYIENGYPIDGVKEYLLNIANSNVYDWRIQNPRANINDFELKLEKLNKAGALFDMVKLEDICKEYISRLSAVDVYGFVLDWASRYDKELEGKLVDNKEYCINIFNIEREGNKIRKDMCKWSDARDMLDIFFDDTYSNINREGIDIDPNLRKDILNEYMNRYTGEEDPKEWFDMVKDIAVKYNFCIDFKEYESSPGKYNGKVGDIAMLIRIAVTKRSKTPDLYQVMIVLGRNVVLDRIKEYIV